MANAVARVSNAGGRPSDRSFRQMYAQRATASSENNTTNTEETKENQPFTGTILRD